MSYLELASRKKINLVSLDAETKRVSQKQGFLIFEVSLI